MVEIIKKNKKADFVVVDKCYLKMSESDKNRKVNVYDVQSIANMHQIIGYAKYKYRDYDVLYRGTTSLYDNVMPSLYRDLYDVDKQNEKWKKLLKTMDQLKENKEMIAKLKLDELSDDWKKNLVVEAIIQHYGGKTTCLDVVDNIWIALWFGLNRYVEYKKKSGRYSTYETRNENGEDRDLYQFIYLFAVKDNINIRRHDVNKPTGIYSVDLREILTSIFIRPYAQHAWMLKSSSPKIDKNNNYANNVIAILRIKTNISNEWLGDGESLQQYNLFPSPVFDYGYEFLLQYQESRNKNYYVRYF